MALGSQLVGEGTQRYLDRLTSQETSGVAHNYLDDVIRRYTLPAVVALSAAALRGGGIAISVNATERRAVQNLRISEQDWIDQRIYMEGTLGPDITRQEDGGIVLVPQAIEVVEEAQPRGYERVTQLLTEYHKQTHYAAIFARDTLRQFEV